MEEDESKGHVSYYVKRHGDDGQVKPLRVTQIITHPKYKLEDINLKEEELEDDSKESGYRRDSQIAKWLRFDITQMNNDVVLIKIEDDRLSPQNTSSSSVACVNALEGWGSPASRIKGRANMFSPPTESLPPLPLVKSAVAFCYAVGHSLVYTTDGLRYVNQKKFRSNLYIVAVPCVWI